MSDIRDPGTDQQLPVTNDRPFIQDLVITDIEQRRQLGIRKYGTALQSGNGRDMLLDAYEEALDLVIYLRGLLDERERQVDPDAAEVKATLRWAANRLEADLSRFPKRGAHVRAWWPVQKLRDWAGERDRSGSVAGARGAE